MAESDTSRRRLSSLRPLALPHLRRLEKEGRPGIAALPRGATPVGGGGDDDAGLLRQNGSISAAKLWTPESFSHPQFQSEAKRWFSPPQASLPDLHFSALFFFLIEGFSAERNQLKKKERDVLDASLDGGGEE